MEVGLGGGVVADWGAWTIWFFADVYDGGCSLFWLFLLSWCYESCLVWSYWWTNKSPHIKWGKCVQTILSLHTTVILFVFCNLVCPVCEVSCWICYEMMCQTRLGTPTDMFRNYTEAHLALQPTLTASDCTYQGLGKLPSYVSKSVPCLSLSATLAYI